MCNKGSSSHNVPTGIIKFTITAVAAAAAAVVTMTTMMMCR